MLTPDQLLAYLEGTLDAEERARVEESLASDPAAQRQLAEQQSMDQALRVVLGDRVDQERVKQSILTVVRGVPLAQLKAQVMETTAGKTMMPAELPFVRRLIATKIGRAHV